MLFRQLPDDVLPVELVKQPQEGGLFKLDPDDLLTEVDVVRVGLDDEGLEELVNILLSGVLLRLAHLRSGKLEERVKLVVAAAAAVGVPTAMVLEGRSGEAEVAAWDKGQGGS